MARSSGKIKTDRRELREEAVAIVVLSGIAAVICGGVGLIGGIVWAAVTAALGALLAAIVIAGFFFLAISAEADDDAEGPSDEEGYRHGLWIVKHPNGNPKSQVTYVHGVREGAFGTWYETGQKASEGAHQSGKLHGSVLSWYENGQKCQEAHYVEGELRGPHTAWHENGQTKSEATYHREDVLHGDCNQWHEDGQKWIEAGYVYGTPHGQWTEWDAEGLVRRRTRFLAGVQFGRGTRFFSPPFSALGSAGARPWRKAFSIIVLVAAATGVWHNNPILGSCLLGVWGVILIHELGHFAVAKLAGIPIQEFVVGFGPKLMALLFGHTRCELRLIPVFGYVGEYEFRPSELEYYQRARDLVGQGEPVPDYPVVDAADERKMASQYLPRPRRLAFVLGGVAFNLLAAFLVAWLALAVAVDTGHKRPPLGRGPVAAARLVVSCSSNVLAMVVPSLRDQSSPDARRSVSIVGRSLGVIIGAFFTLSICLPLLNLLPIPTLDGFDALRICIEMVLRREVPQRMLRPAMIGGALLIGVLFVRALASLGIATVVSVFGIDVQQEAKRSEGPAGIVGQPTGAVMLERQLKLLGAIKEGWKDIEPKAGNRFLGLRFHVDAEKTLVPREYAIKDESGNHYNALGVAFGKVGVEFHGATTAERVTLGRAAKGYAVQHYTRRAHRLTGWDLLLPEITLLYEVPEEATQFQLQHHSLRHTFRLETQSRE